MLKGADTQRGTAFILSPNVKDENCYDDTMNVVVCLDVVVGGTRGLVQNSTMIN